MSDFYQKTTWFGYANELIKSTFADYAKGMVPYSPAQHQDYTKNYAADPFHRVTYNARLDNLQTISKTDDSFKKLSDFFTENNEAGEENNKITLKKENRYITKLDETINNVLVTNTEKDLIHGSSLDKIKQWLSLHPLNIFSPQFNALIRFRRFSGFVSRYDAEAYELVSKSRKVFARLYDGQQNAYELATDANQIAEYVNNNAFPETEHSTNSSNYVKPYRVDGYRESQAIKQLKINHDWLIARNTAKFYKSNGQGNGLEGLRLRIKKQFLELEHSAFNSLKLKERFYRPIQKTIAPVYEHWYFYGPLLPLTVPISVVTRLTQKVFNITNHLADFMFNLGCIVGYDLVYSPIKSVLQNIIRWSPLGPGYFEAQTVDQESYELLTKAKIYLDKLKDSNINIKANQALASIKQNIKQLKSDLENINSSTSNELFTYEQNKQQLNAKLDELRAQITHQYNLGQIDINDKLTDLLDNRWMLSRPEKVQTDNIHTPTSDSFGSNEDNAIAQQDYSVSTNNIQISENKSNDSRNNSDAYDPDATPHSRSSQQRNIIDNIGDYKLRMTHRYFTNYTEHTADTHASNSEPEGADVDADMLEALHLSAFTKHNIDQQIQDLDKELQQTITPVLEQSLPYGENKVLQQKLLTILKNCQVSNDDRNLKSIREKVEQGNLDVIDETKLLLNYHGGDHDQQINQLNELQDELQNAKSELDGEIKECLTNQATNTPNDITQDITEGIITRQLSKLAKDLNNDLYDEVNTENPTDGALQQTINGLTNDQLKQAYQQWLEQIRQSDHKLRQQLQNKTHTISYKYKLLQINDTVSDLYEKAKGRDIHQFIDTYKRLFIDLQSRWGPLNGHCKNTGAFDKGLAAEHSDKLKMHKKVYNHLAKTYKPPRERIINIKNQHKHPFADGNHKLLQDLLQSGGHNSIYYVMSEQDDSGETGANGEANSHKKRLIRDLLDQIQTNERNDKLADHLSQKIDDLFDSSNLPNYIKQTGIKDKLKNNQNNVEAINSELTNIFKEIQQDTQLSDQVDEIGRVFSAIENMHALKLSIQNHQQITEDQIRNMVNSLTRIDSYNEYQTNRRKIWADKLTEKIDHIRNFLDKVVATGEGIVATALALNLLLKKSVIHWFHHGYKSLFTSVSQAFSNHWSKTCALGTLYAYDGAILYGGVRSNYYLIRNKVYKVLKFLFSHQGYAYDNHTGEERPRPLRLLGYTSIIAVSIAATGMGLLSLASFYKVFDTYGLLSYLSKSMLMVPATGIGTLTSISVLGLFFTGYILMINADRYGWLKNEFLHYASIQKDLGMNTDYVSHQTKVIFGVRKIFEFLLKYSVLPFIMGLAFFGAFGYFSIVKGKITTAFNEALPIAYHLGEQFSKGVNNFISVVTATFGQFVFFTEGNNGAVNDTLVSWTKVKNAGFYLLTGVTTLAFAPLLFAGTILFGLGELITRGLQQIGIDIGLMKPAADPADIDKSNKEADKIISTYCERHQSKETRLQFINTLGTLWNGIAQGLGALDQGIKASVGVAVGSTGQNLCAVWGLQQSDPSGRTHPSIMDKVNFVWQTMKNSFYSKDAKKDSYWTATSCTDDGTVNTYQYDQQDEHGNDSESDQIRHESSIDESNDDETQYSQIGDWNFFASKAQNAFKYAERQCETYDKLNELQTAIPT